MRVLIASVCCVLSIHSLSQKAKGEEDSICVFWDDEGGEIYARVIQDRLFQDHCIVYPDLENWPMLEYHKLTFESDAYLVSWCAESDAQYDEEVLSCPRPLPSPDLFLPNEDVSCDVCGGPFGPKYESHHEPFSASGLVKDKASIDDCNTSLGLYAASGIRLYGCTEGPWCPQTKTNGGLAVKLCDGWHCCPTRIKEIDAKVWMQLIIGSSDPAQRQTWMFSLEAEATYPSAMDCPGGLECGLLDDGLRRAVVMISAVNGSISNPMFIIKGGDHVVAQGYSPIAGEDGKWMATPALSGVGDDIVEFGLYSFGDRTYDMDEDRRFTRWDVQALAQAAPNMIPEEGRRWDFNGDGIVDAYDVAVLQEFIDLGLGSGVLGDLDDDGCVDVEDCAMMTVADAPNPAIFGYVLGDAMYHAELDFDLDGDTDQDDWNSFQSTVCGDCNLNGVIDGADICAGTSTDCDVNRILDECQLGEDDCNCNGLVDSCEIDDETSTDSDSDGVPDECQLESDCNGNGVQDSCDTGSGASADCNHDWLPDECQLLPSTGENIVQDPGFEAGALAGHWEEYELIYDSPICGLWYCDNSWGIAPHGGFLWAWLGWYDQATEASLEQTVVIPELSSSLGFYLHIGLRSGNGTDYFNVLVDGEVLWTALENTPGFDEYELVRVDVSNYADGQPHVIRFESVVTGMTAFALDDVSLYQAVNNDCNGNHVPDACDVAPTDGSFPASRDWNHNGVPDECEGAILKPNKKKQDLPEMFPLGPIHR